MAGHCELLRYVAWGSAEALDVGRRANVGAAGLGNGAARGGDVDGCIGMQWRWPGSRAARAGTAGIDRVLRDKGRFCCLKVRWCCGKEKEEARGQRQTSARGQGVGCQGLARCT